jgi:SAM-dependent methyltransferase
MVDPVKDEATCRLCGGPLGAAELVHTEPDRFERAASVSAVGYCRAWRRCLACAALIDVQRPEDELALERLTASYYEVDLGTGIEAKFDKVMALLPHRSDNAGRVERVADACRQLSPGGRPEHLVVDVGAGTGVFLARFLPSMGDNWKGIAIEPDPLAAAHLRKLDQFDVIPAMFGADLELPPADLITFNKVIEHIASPKPVLECAATCLKRGGLVYVEVPDALTARYCPPQDNILGALHKHLYEPETLATLLRCAGYAVLKVARIVDPSGKLTVYAFACRADDYGERRQSA